MKLKKEQIEFLDKVVNGTWVINSDGEVDVYGNVWMDDMNLSEIPVKFGKVSRFFSCSNNKLTSLEFAPKSVGGYFWCHHNQLTSLEFAPNDVYFHFSIFWNPIVEKLEHIDIESFLHWDKLDWFYILQFRPMLVNFLKRVVGTDQIKTLLEMSPNLKLYLE